MDFRKHWKGTLAVTVVFCMTTGLLVTGLPFDARRKDVVAEEGLLQIPEARSVNLNILQGDNSYQIAGLTDPEEAMDVTASWSNGNGCYVYYGEYYQSDVDSNTKEPIKWCVLDADTTDFSEDDAENNHTMLLLSEDILEFVQYYADGVVEEPVEGSGNTQSLFYTDSSKTHALNDYNESILRKWLNSHERLTASGTTGYPFEFYSNIEDGFYDTAFKTPEQLAIAVSSQKPKNYINGNMRTYGWSQDGKEDKIMALSQTDFRNPLYGFISNSNGECRRAGYTSHALAKGDRYAKHDSPSAYLREEDAYFACISNWDNRSQYSASVSVVSGGMSGVEITTSARAGSIYAGVRPAMNLKLENVAFTTLAGVDKTQGVALTTQAAQEWKLAMTGGDGFQLGSKEDKTAQAGGFVDVMVADIGTPLEGVDYTQISVMYVDDSGTVAAYGWAGNLHAGAMQVAVPEGIEAGTYRLMLFAEDVNSTATSNQVDFVSNMDEINVTIKEKEAELPEEPDEETPPAVVPEEPGEETPPAVVPEVPGEETPPAVVPEEPGEETPPAVVPDRPDEETPPAVVPKPPEATIQPPLLPDDFTYSVTVIGGSGTGQYHKDDIVKIVAGDPPEGKRFVGWEVITKGVALVDPNGVETTFSMPEHVVEIRAIYEPEEEPKPTDGTQTEKPTDNPPASEKPAGDATTSPDVSEDVPNNTQTPDGGDSVPKVGNLQIQDNENPVVLSIDQKTSVAQPKSTETVSVAQQLKTGDTDAVLPLMLLLCGALVCLLAAVLQRNDYMEE